MYHYRITKAENVNSTYGKCEVCGRWVNTMYVQTKEKEYMPKRVFGEAVNPLKRYSHQSITYGHYHCLMKLREE
jgi:hypothetical protein